MAFQLPNSWDISCRTKNSKPSNRYGLLLSYHNPNRLGGIILVYIFEHHSPIICFAKEYIGKNSEKGK
jgi:hypothetical protein